MAMNQHSQPRCREAARKGNPTTAVETKLGELQKRPAALESRLATEAAAVEAAQAGRRWLLLEIDLSDGAALDQAEAACRAAETGASRRSGVRFSCRASRPMLRRSGRRHRE